MTIDDSCPRCGSRQPRGLAAGLCPQCLLRFGLEADLPTGVNGADETGLVIDRLRDSDRDFVRHQSGAALAAGVLSALDESIGPVPRVLLRESAADEPRPVRPRSKEMPDLKGDPGRYHLLGELARGGMGVILKGRDVDLGRDLAVKVILEQYRDHPEMIRRFVEEAQIGGQLQHPGIVPVHEIGRFPDGRLYIAMKLVKGRTLAALLNARMTPAEDRARFLSIFEQVCQTMAYAHARGVVHRDLKPSNVMVGDFGEVQVMDWGLAKVIDHGGLADEEKARRGRGDSCTVRTLRSGSRADQSQAGSVLGTPAYMAPEQARGALDLVDERADVFGLGSILCEIVTGLPAYAGRSTAELYRQAEFAELNDALARLDSCGADSELAALAKSCLASMAKDRPRDAGVVSASLTAYLAGVERRLGAAGLARAKAEARAIEERKRRLLTVALAASVLVTAVFCGGGWLWVARDRAAREERAAGEVNKALTEAALLRGEARSDPGKWADALATARRALSLLNDVEGRPSLRQRVRDLVTAVAREHDETEAVEKDRRIVERLAEIHDDYAVHLDRAMMESQYVTAFREYGVDVDGFGPAQAGARLAARPVAAELAGALDHWAHNRRQMNPPDLRGARHLIEVAKATDPDPWRHRLRDALERMATDREEALSDLEQLAGGADMESLPAASATRLAKALLLLGDKMTAVALLRRAQRAHPGDFWINWDLGNELKWAAQPDDAIRFLSVAVAIRPRSGLALRTLGKTLQETGRLEDAAATFRQAMRAQEDHVENRVCLGSVLMDLAEEDKANAEFHEAKRQKPEDGLIRNEIANVFRSRGDWDAALAELREATRCLPTNAIVHDMLGLALREVGRVDEAVALFREAVRLDPRLTPAYVNLGRALLAKGEFEAGLEAFRQGHAGSDGPYHGSSAAVVHEAERMIALEQRLPAILQNNARLADAAERAEVARLCRAKELYTTSVRFWGEAFAARPALAHDLKADNRYAAASAAALAGCGQGKEEPKPGAIPRERLRRQALDWLNAELAASAPLLEKGSTPRVRAEVLRRLGRWRVDPALAGIRDEAAIAVLPEAERRALRVLWSRVEILLEQASGRSHRTAALPRL